MSAGNRVVGIVDYEAGNVRSIDNAFAYLGARTVRVRGEQDLAECSHLVLPGVGAFGFCAERLLASGLTDRLQHWALIERRPLLGICVGMQLLADGSEESPHAPGLGWIGGAVRKLAATPGIRVPHVGWNDDRVRGAARRFRGRQYARMSISTIRSPTRPRAAE